MSTFDDNGKLRARREAWANMGGDRYDEILSAELVVYCGTIETDAQP